MSGLCYLSDVDARRRAGRLGRDGSGEVVVAAAQRARDAARAVLLARAVDTTAESAGRTLLVVAPHPDDETIGCGARIARARAAGTPVTVVVATRGERAAGGAPDAHLGQRRAAELRTALATLGVAPGDLHQLGHPDGALADRVTALADEIGAVVRAVRPSDVCVTGLDEPHPDHAAAAAATRRALAAVADPPRLLEYPIWLWSVWPLSRQHRAGSLARAGRLAAGRHVERVALGEVAAVKEQALAAYESQLGEQGLPPAVLARAVRDPELVFVVPRRRWLSSR